MLVDLALRYMSAQPHSIDIERSIKAHKVVKSKVRNLLKNKTTCKLLSIYHNSCLFLSILEEELEYAEAAAMSGAVTIDADVSDL